MMNMQTPSAPVCYPCAFHFVNEAHDLNLPCLPELLRPAIRKLPDPQQLPWPCAMTLPVQQTSLINPNLFTLNPDLSPFLHPVEHLLKCH